jgi:hypothetical protein
VGFVKLLSIASFWALVVCGPLFNQTSTHTHIHLNISQMANALLIATLLVFIAATAIAAATVAIQSQTIKLFAIAAVYRCDLVARLVMKAYQY